MIKVNFWIIIALLYLALAISSFIVSKRHSEATRLKHSEILIEGKPYMKATYDYLNVSTWINAIGFFLAALAAIVAS